MSAAEDKDIFVQKLTDLGVARLVVEYSGHGDSGQVDGVTAYLTHEDAESGVWEKVQDVDELDRAHTPVGEVVVKVAKALMNEDDKKLSDALSNFAYDVLEYLGVSDWYNNEGGGGRITMFVTEHESHDHPAGHIVVDHYYYTQQIHEETYKL